MEHGRWNIVNGTWNSSTRRKESEEREERREGESRVIRALKKIGVSEFSNFQARKSSRGFGLLQDSPTTKKKKIHFSNEPFFLIRISLIISLVLSLFFPPPPKIFFLSCY